MLMAARDTYGDDINSGEHLAKDVNEKEKEGKIVTLFGDSIFHNDGQVERDGLDQENVNNDLSSEEHKEPDDELRGRDTKRYVQKGVERLASIIVKHNSVFETRLGSDGPAKVQPMKMVPAETKKSVIVDVTM